MMNKKQDVLEQLRQLLGLLRKDYGVERLSLFGSVAREEATASSDLDILVSFQGKATYDNFIELKLFLENTFNTSVDLVTEASLDERIRPYVEEDIIRVA